jgi:hypothetical protein
VIKSRKNFTISLGIWNKEGGESRESQMDTGRIRNAYTYVRKPEEKRPPGRPRRKWENNIKTDLT